MDTKKLLKLHRVQSSSTYMRQSSPVKRVLISACGKIEFNPNEQNYIYFSSTDEHHVYYIFSKVIGIIIKELEKYKNTNAYKRLNLPEYLSPFYFYTQTHSSIIKSVQDFFSNYLPPESVELVTLNYLHEFGDFLNKCKVSNKHIKDRSNTPETSDEQFFNGAYGINDAWLELLKASTVSTSIASLSFDNFFTFLLENTHRGSLCRGKLSRVLTKNPEFFDLLSIVTYRELQNPEFKDKNNINNMRKAIKLIEQKKLYNPSIKITSDEFRAQTKKFRDEIVLNR